MRPRRSTGGRWGVRRREVAWRRHGTIIGSLHSRVTTQFGYRFDFGDDWWHRTEVLGIADGATREGAAGAPQYVDWDEEG